MINYSIIIPHKNIPDLLQRCLDSIPRGDDVQIIVVDDNSDDNKVDFANFPGLNDPYVEVIFGKNENGRKGAGYARNLGLERAKGKWLVFADADDFFMPCFDEVLDLYKDDDENDEVYFFVTSSDLTNGRHIYHNNLLLEGDWEDINIHHHTPYGKFIKREIIQQNEISFQEIQCANDVMFGIKANCASSEQKIDNAIIYFITERENSLVTTITVESLSIRFAVRCQAVDYAKKVKAKDSELKIGVYNTWLQIFRRNKIKAIKLFPKVVRKSNFNAFVFVMAKDYPKLKKYYVWRKLMNLTKIN